MLKTPHHISTTCLLITTPYVNLAYWNIHQQHGGVSCDIELAIGVCGTKLIFYNKKYNGLAGLLLH